MLPCAPPLIASLVLFLLSGSEAIRLPHLQKNDVRPAVIPEDWTNAQRLAAGLPPHAPRFLKRATRTHPELGLFKRMLPSPSPSSVTSSHIQVAAIEPTQTTGRILARMVGENTPLGFVQLSSSDASLDIDDGANVSFITTPGSSLFTIAVTTSNGDNAPKYLGASGTSAIASGSASTAKLSHVSLTSPHARPGHTGSESAIWTLDATTQRLLPHFVNPDGSHPRTKLAYSADKHEFVLMGNIDVYNLAHPDAAVKEVAFYFMSD